MNANKITKSIEILLLVLNALFIIYYLMLAIYSQPHYDDLHFMWKMNEMSIYDYVKEMYLSRSGRFVAYGLNGVIFSVVNIVGYHQFWPIVFYIIGVLICCKTAKECIKSIDSTVLFNVILLIYNIYILINIDFAVFNWLCAMSYYLLAPSCCLLFCYLNKSILKWYDYVVLSLLVVFLGGGQEAFTPVVLLIMFFNGLYYWHKNDWDIKVTWDLPQIRRIVYVAIAMIILLLIVVVAPGNYVRMADTSQFIHPVGIIGWIKSIVHANGMYLYFMIFYIPYMFILFTITYLLGNRYGTRCLNRIQKIKIVFLLLFSLFIYTLVSSLPNVYLYGGFGIQRSYTHCVFVLLLCVAVCGYVLGDAERKSNIPSFVPIIGLLTFISIMSINIYNDIPVAQQYSEAVNERIEQLQDLQTNGNKEVVVVKELPQPEVNDIKSCLFAFIGKKISKPSLYYTSDTDTVPNEYMYHFKRVYGIDFDFIIE